MTATHQTGYANADEMKSLSEKHAKTSRSFWN